MGLIFWPDDVQGLRQFGVKGEELHLLRQAGAPVPDWFLVPPEAFYTSLTEEEYDQLLDVDSVSKAQDLSLSFKLSFDLNKLLEESVYKLCPNDERVAVRPSATDRDTRGNSKFLANHESYLFIEIENIARAVRAVWKAAFSPTLMQARAAAGLALVPKAPSVIVQKMLAADSSGTAFSANPQSGRRDEVVIHAVPGLSTSMIVNGSGHDIFLVNKQGKVQEKTIAEKRTKHICDHETMHGVVQVEIPDTESRAPALNDKEAVELATMTRKVAANCGQPKAVTWARENGKTYALGMHEIAELAGMPDPDATEYVWDTAPLSFSMPGLVTPLTASVYRAAWGEAVVGALVLMGFSKDLSAKTASDIKLAIGCIEGRLYLNLTKLADALAKLPGCKALKDDFSVIFNCPETLLDKAWEQLPPAVKRANLVAAVGMPTRVGTALKSTKSYERKFISRISKLKDRITKDIEILEIEEIFSRLELTNRELSSLLGMRLLSAMRVKWFWHKLSELTRDHCSDHGGTIARSLVISDKVLPGVNLIDACGELASSCAANDAVADILRSNDDEKALRALGRDENLYELYNAALQELIAETRWLEHGGPLTEKDYTILLLDSLRCGAAASSSLTVEGGESPTQRVKRISQEKITQSLNQSPTQLKQIRQTNSSLQVCCHHYLGLNQAYVKLLNAIGKMYLRAGELMREGGALTSADDIVWLSSNEIDDFLGGRLYESNLQNLIEQRQSLFGDRFQSDLPPASFSSHGPVNLGNQIPQKGKSEIGHEVKKVTGVGCGAGLIRARVRVAFNFENFQLRSGEILVLPTSDTRFRVALHAVGGLIVETGSVIDEFILLAINMGKPVVIGPAGVCTWLQSGESVEINAAEGRILKTV